ncbi:sensor histidine kinase [Actinoplanes sp. RD1]|uniref:sensor histidine kinase n=1 Tax=Actinoplanes sp. RD1 TaxID=3064538 RepID=UPI0027428F56|nr:HAMP domain-containing sensor histidine kinase [Actinoplanes sp. RD1]
MRQFLRTINRRLSLRARLVLSHVLVLLMAIGTTEAAIQLLKGPHRRPFNPDDAVSIGLAAGAITALLAAVLLSRLLLRPLDSVRAATHRLARGHYDDVLATPDEPELAGLVTDVNALATVLAGTERRRARLVSEIAHEMKTPITILRGQIEGLADGIFPADEAMFASLTDDLARLERLAGDLSRLSVAEEGAFELQRRPTDVAALARVVAERLHPQYDDHRVALSVTASVPVVAWCDPDRITQVLVNLLGNALTACRAGGRVRVTARAAAEPTPRAEVSVTDDGAGIRAADLERIFGRFERLHRPDRPAPAGGSGIGLTIARGIARAHSGDVTAASPGPGRGATFTLTIPIPPR